MFSSKTPSSSTAAGGGDGGSQRRGWMSGMLAMVRDKTLSPRVVQPSRGGGNKSWSCSTGVITDLTHFERVSLNAAEERVLPPDIRIKIVFAQANAGEQEEEMLEADVKRLDGLVRTIALYSILERNMMDPPKADKLTPEREAYLGKMLVAAVQLELFQMLDDICEAGDVENELFDDLCSDTIQDGRRAGFIMMTAALLLSPGSGYKRLLQIRKDQILEEIADVAGLRRLGGHDCQRDSSESPKTWSPRYRRRKEMDSDCGSPDPDSAGAAAAGLRISPNTADPRNTAASNLTDDDLSPSPSSQRPDSRSPSPEIGHRRTQTQRVRDLLSSIDGLVMESEQTEEEDDALANLTASPRGRSVRGYKRQSTGAHLDSFDAGGASQSSRLSLHTPPGGDDDGEGDDGRAFFSNGRGWRVSPFAGTPPTELAKRRASVIPTPGAEEGDDPESADMLLAEVDWLIAGTNAVLGVTEKDDDDNDNDNDHENNDNSGGGGDPIGNDGLEITPDKREDLASSPTREDVPESSTATRVVAQDEEARGDTIDSGADPIGKNGLEITPDKRELSPARSAQRSNGGDVPESADATRVAATSEEEEVESVEEGVSQEEEQEVPPPVKHESAEGDGADAQQAESPVPSPERALTASPSPEARVSGPSTEEEVVGLNGGGHVSDDDGRNDVTMDAGASEEEQGNKEQSAVGGVVEPSHEEASAPVGVDVPGGVGDMSDEGEGVTEEADGGSRQEVEGQTENGNPTEDVAGGGGGGGEGAAAEEDDEIEDSPIDGATLEPALSEDEAVVIVAASDDDDDDAGGGEVNAPVGVAEVPLEVGEAEREGQGKEEEEEESGRIAGDAVVESGVASGVAPEAVENGGVVLARNDSLDGKEEEGGVVGREGDLGAAILVPESTKQEEQEHDEAAGDNGSGDHALSFESPEEESTGVSDMDDHPPAADVALEVVESDASREAGDDGPAIVVVDTEVDGLANEGELISSDNVAPVAFHGHSRSIPGNGLQKDPLGSGKGGEGANVEVEGGADAPMLEDVEL